MPISVTGRTGVNYSRRTALPDFTVGTPDFDDANRSYVYVLASGAVPAGVCTVTGGFGVNSSAGSYTADTAFASGEFGWVRKTTSPL